jgi:sugar phosphate isomerase/epimerase
MPKLGIRLESLGLALRAALSEAARLGVSGVQIDSTGDLHPDRLTQTGRREFRNLLRSHNLQLTALGCPLRRGLDTGEDQEPRLEFVRKALTLSFDLGARIVVADMPPLPTEGDVVRQRLLRDALIDLGAHGDRIGATLALETGLDSPEALAEYFRRFDHGSLRVNYDPANLLVNGHDPIAGLTPLRPFLAHVHARDAQRGRASRTAQETTLGAGDIDWMAFMAVLDTFEYRGWVVVERESGDNRRGDIAAGVAFLRRFLRP